MLSLAILGDFFTFGPVGSVHGAPHASGVATLYDALRLLAAYGWVEWLRVGDRRYLRHPARPGVEITLRGRQVDPLDPEALDFILGHAGLGEE